jgi:transposase
MLAFLDPETRIPPTHPIRVIRALCDSALGALSPIFDQMYARIGRPSIPPERLLKAGVLMALYTVRSGRAFRERLDDDILFRWFLRMSLVEPRFDPTVFTKNRQRLLEHRVAQEFFDAVLAQAWDRELLSDEHFSVDGTLIEAAASLKSFRRRDEEPPGPSDDPGNRTGDFRGERRTNATHVSTTDPEARLMRKGKGKETKLVFMAHALMENRNGLLADLQVTEADGYAERETAIEMIDQAIDNGMQLRSVGADKGYDTQSFVAAMRQRDVTPRVAQNTSGRRSAIDGRTTRHPGYAESQRVRKRIEEIFGWLKPIGGLRRTRYHGVERTQVAAYLVGAAYNLCRMAR